jgi:hypothetical protein
MTSVYGAVTGLQDSFLTENPDFTHFNPVITRDSPGTIRTHVIPFDTQDFYYATIPNRGEFITDITLKMSLPGLVDTNDSYWSFLDLPPGYMHIGHTTNSNTIISPQNIDVNQINLFNSLLPNITINASGPDFFLAVDTSNRLWVSGNNSRGQLGTGTTSNVITLQTISVPFTVSKIACGASHTAIIDTTGNVWVAGDNLYGQLGIGNLMIPHTTFEQVPYLTATNVACCFNTTFIWTPGETSGFYYTGLDVLNGNTSSVVPFTFISKDVQSIFCGPNNLFLLSTTGILSASGQNVNLGISSSSPYIIGFEISSAPNISSSTIFNIGYNYSAYVGTDGLFYVAGYFNTYFEVDGTFGQPVSFPVFNLYGYAFVFYDSNLDHPNTFRYRDTLNRNVTEIWPLQSTITNSITFSTFFIFNSNSIIGNASTGILPGIGNYNASDYITTLLQIINSKFVIQSETNLIYFDSLAVANFFGYDTLNLTKLVSGTYVYYGSGLSPLTLRQSGFIQGTDVAVNPIYKYPSYENIINSVSLLFGKQVIQTIPGEYLQFKKEISTSFKNRPILALLDGDGSNIVPTNRSYYISLPGLLQNIPIYTLFNQDVQISLDYNTLPGINFSLLVNYLKLSNVAPSFGSFNMTVPQYTTQDPKGPCTKIFVTGNLDTVTLNGETMFNSDCSNVAAFENFTNVPVTGTTVVFNGPINLSRIRDLKVSSESSNVYYETLNILKVEGGISGLLFS